LRPGMCPKALWPPLSCRSAWHGKRRLTHCRSRQLSSLQGRTTELDHGPRAAADYAMPAGDVCRITIPSLAAGAYRLVVNATWTRSNDTRDDLSRCRTVNDRSVGHLSCPHNITAGLVHACDLHFVEGYEPKVPGSSA
jgi:hypothetical protein